MSALEDRRARRQVGKAAYRRRRFAVFGLVMTLVLGIAGFGLYRFWNKPLSATLPPPVTLDTKRFTMLVLGADDRPNQPGRSDTMMVGFVDLEQGDVKLLSIPRDSYAQIPGHGWNKINAAYPFGGAALVKETVEQLIGMPINYTVAVNMQGFEKIVDAVDGVDIEIPEDMDYVDPTPPALEIHLKKGLQHLDGADALHYVRFRNDAESDWGRMRRQQQFLQALTEAALKPASLTRLPELVTLGSQNVTTNLSLNQLTQLARLGKDKLGADKISGGTLEGDDIWAPDGYYLGLHFADMRAKVRELAGIPADETLLARDDSDAQAYRDALPEGTSLPGGDSSGSEDPDPTPVAPPAGDGSGGTEPGTGTTTPGESGTGTPPATGGVTPAPGGTDGNDSSGTNPGTEPGTEPGTSPRPEPTPQPGAPGGGTSPGPAPTPGPGTGDGGSDTPPAPDPTPTPNPDPTPGPGTGNTSPPPTTPSPPSSSGT